MIDDYSGWFYDGYFNKVFPYNKETKSNTEIEYKKCEDGRVYQFIVPGFHKSELKVFIFDDDRRIIVDCKNDTITKSNIEIEVPYEMGEITAKLENGILYVTVLEYHEEPYEVEID